MSSLKQALIDAIPGALLEKLVREMVAIPSRNPPGEEKACSEYIYNQLSNWGIETERLSVPEESRPQVVAWLRGAQGQPTLVLNGHVDTVTEGDVAAWHQSPFEPTLDGGRLFGLGTADMKGGLAIAMVVLKTLHDSGVSFPGSLLFQAVMGEEMDEPGTKTLLQEGYRGDYAIVLEPTSMRIGVGTRGACWHEVVLSGTQTHCGLAQPGDTDLTYFLAAFIQEVNCHHQRIETTRHALFPPPACRITQIGAGERHNSTVGRCKVVIDRRMLPGETYEQVTGELRDILTRTKHKIPAVDFELRFLEGNQPTEVDCKGRLCSVLQRNFNHVLKEGARFWGPPYGSDVRYFIGDYGIEAVNFGPGDFAVCHQPNEFVSVEELHRCAKVVMGTAVDVLSEHDGDGLSS